MCRVFRAPPKPRAGGLRRDNGQQSAQGLLPLRIPPRQDSMLRRAPRVGVEQHGQQTVTTEL